MSRGEGRMGKLKEHRKGIKEIQCTGGGKSKRLPPKSMQHAARNFTLEVLLLQVQLLQQPLQLQQPQQPEWAWLARPSGERRMHKRA